MAIFDDTLVAAILKTWPQPFPPIAYSAFMDLVLMDKVSEGKKPAELVAAARSLSNMLRQLAWIEARAAYKGIRDPDFDYDEADSEG